MFSNRQIEWAILHFFVPILPNFKVERSKSNQDEKHAERYPYVSSILNCFACASFEKGEGAMKERKNRNIFCSEDSECFKRENKK